MRSISLLKGALLPYVGVLISNLASKLGTVSKVSTFVSFLNHKFTQIEVKNERSSKFQGHIVVERVCGFNPLAFI